MKLMYRIYMKLFPLILLLILMSFFTAKAEVKVCSKLLDKILTFGEWNKIQQQVLNEIKEGKRNIDKLFQEAVDKDEFLLVFNGDIKYAYFRLRDFYGDDYTDISYYTGRILSQLSDPLVSMERKQFFISRINEALYTMSKNENTVIRALVLIKKYSFYIPEARPLFQIDAAKVMKIIQQTITSGKRIKFKDPSDIAFGKGKSQSEYVMWLSEAISENLPEVPLLKF